MRGGQPPRTFCCPLLLRAFDQLAPTCKAPLIDFLIYGVPISKGPTGGFTQTAIHSCGCTMGPDVISRWLDRGIHPQHSFQACDILVKVGLMANELDPRLQAFDQLDRAQIMPQIESGVLDGIHGSLGLTANFFITGGQRFSECICCWESCKGDGLLWRPRVVEPGSPFPQPAVEAGNEAVYGLAYEKTKFCVWLFTGHPFEGESVRQYNNLRGGVTTIVLPDHCSQRRAGRLADV